ncbi:protein of unknown function [Amycolatopsis xylanica]|uniref:eCIS core domain-containing protein n=1 Tax=Amycolatopsis xylanica TaxID=589385 RepID=A0A1H2U9U6_9PSEU|nr:DUF4157 domain-containing protein [Amycolatopsis xylanica]SDW52379.1 protein of unknown function [Amycolatopsis xylanica]
MKTLGERLDEAGQALAGRHAPIEPAGGRFAPVLRRAERLAAGFGDRFERTEAPSAPLVRRAPQATEETTTAVEQPSTVEPPEPGRPVPADVRARLREVSGPGADVLRVHDDPAADVVAREHRADAVTTGADVYFREGRFRPDEPAGFGLLAHETTHVSAHLEPGKAARRATAGGIAAEENLAVSHEIQAIHPTHSAESPSPGLTPGQPAQPPSAPGAQTPMTASTDREVPAAAPEPLDLGELRRGLIDDVMRLLRTDFERGG